MYQIWFITWIVLDCVYIQGRFCTSEIRDPVIRKERLYHDES